MNHNLYIMLSLLITAFLSSTIYMSLNYSGHAGISRLILRNTKNHDLLIKWQNKWNHLIDYVTISSNDNVLALIVRPGSIGLVLDEKKVSEEIKFFKEILLNSKIKVDQGLMLQL